ncbi:alpha-actinin [Neurospora intermedia]|uniref:Alpha-actinin n=1 Tax=Neurospora intermedia TaxID=5142 RepID=A0ABR3DMF6_NEUIN
MPGVEIGEPGPSAQSGQPAAALPDPATAPARAAAQSPTQSTNSTTSTGGPASLARSRSCTGASTSSRSGSWGETHSGGPAQVEKFPDLPTHTTSSEHQQQPLHHPHHRHHQHHQPASEAVRRDGTCAHAAEGTPTPPAAPAAAATPTPVPRLPNTDHTELTSPGPPPTASFPAIGRPPSLSFHSTASSSDHSSSLSDGDLVFDSRRSSVVTSASTASAYHYPLSSSCHQPDSSPEHPLTRTRRDAKQIACRPLALASTKREAPSPGLRNPTRFQRASSEPTRAPKLITEQPAGFTKMAFAEQQQWITVQQKTFTKWLNTKIEVRGLEVKDLVKDLSDAVMLIHLLECLSGDSLGRYAAKPKLRVQRFENANLALNFIKSRGIQMTNIGAEDIVDGNRKIILGLIWTLILRFTINDINEEGMTAKEGLLLWCQRKTACYDEVDVRDFSGSWNDGLAFCALLDIHRPDLIDYDALDKSDHRGNMQLAFDIAHAEIGIPKLLDVEDVCDVAKPDERSLMTYIAYWFHAFSQMEKVENAGRRVEKFFNNMQGAWEMQSAYERRMAALLKAIREQVVSWKGSTFDGTYADAKAQAFQFASYKKGRKREWVAEKSDLATLLGNIKTKLATYRLRPYDPPAHLRMEVLDDEWSNLSKAEMSRGQLINETIRDIKDALRKSFADKANDFALALNTMQLAISGLEGDVEDQLHHVRKLSENLPPLDAYLKTIEAVDLKCQEANIEENDFTTYSYDELCYELSLVKSSVSKKLAFLENQMVARNMTNLTPIQLEEFESVFRHFDRDDTNSLSELEFSAALASLGLVFSEDEMHEYFLSTSNGRDRVTFEQFIRFMVDVTEDQNTAEQVFQSFREVADGKPYVTEMDLRHSLVPDEVIEKLIEIIPKHTGPDMQSDRGMEQYDYIAFMEKLILEQEGRAASASSRRSSRASGVAGGGGGAAAPGQMPNHSHSASVGGSISHSRHNSHASIGGKSVLGGGDSRSNGLMMSPKSPGTPGTNKPNGYH